MWMRLAEAYAIVVVLIFIVLLVGTWLSPEKES